MLKTRLFNKGGMLDQILLLGNGLPQGAALLEGHRELRTRIETPPGLTENSILRLNTRRVPTHRRAHLDEREGSLRAGICPLFVTPRGFGNPDKGH